MRSFKTTRMNSIVNIKYPSFLLAALVATMAVSAQDSLRKKTIDITSTFKPVLREAVKINFNAAPPAVDSSRPRLNYTIPQQNLLPGYQPGGLNPVALQVDSLGAWKYNNFVKVGVGNIHIPFIQAGFSFGDNKNTFFNVFANHFTSKGSLSHQKNSQTGVSATGTLRTKGNLEWDGKAGFKAEDFFRYGYRPTSLVFSKTDLRQRYQSFEGAIGLRNTEPTEFGLTYHPNLKISVFGGDSSKHKTTEANTVLNLPLQKTFGKSFAFNLGFTADLTNYRPENKPTVNNNIYYIPISLLLKTPNLFLQVGGTPSWDKKEFKLLPNIMADITTNDQRFTVQLGWISYFDKGSYQRFASINPWIATPSLLLNTRVQERYAGFKGSLANHFTYSAKVGFVSYRNMPLFINDTIDGKSFNTVYSSSMEALQMHGEIGYTKGEDFNATASVTLNQYSKVKDQAKAWGLLPLEFNANMSWQVMKDLYLKSGLVAWDGAPYRTMDGKAFKGNTGFDLNAGVEFRITRQLNLWLQMNNLLNNKYERWNQYEVYGFNILGGIVFTFNNK